MSYKKRAKAGWNVGKGAKESSNKSERIYEKEEISEELNPTDMMGRRMKKRKLSAVEKKIKRLRGDIKHLQWCLDRSFYYWDNEESLKAKIKNAEDKIAELQEQLKEK